MCRTYVRKGWPGWLCLLLHAHLLVLDAQLELQFDLKIELATYRDISVAFAKVSVFFFPESIEGDSEHQSECEKTIVLLYFRVANYPIASEDEHLIAISSTIPRLCQFHVSNVEII